ncbi:MAG: PASTA domain-containing protein [Luteitalea sp.]|nr:PASTA domain-containing protein [Luteitalea sp.]
MNVYAPRPHLGSLSLRHGVENVRRSVADSNKRREAFAAAFNIHRLIRDARRTAAADRPPPARAWRDLVRSRVTVLACFLACWATAIEARLLYLQVLAHDDLVTLAERQQNQTVQAAAKRGDLVDRNGHVLAYSVDGDTIYAVPSDIEAPELVAARVCAVLDDCRRTEQAEIAGRLARNSAFAYVKRRASPEEARRVAALGIDGIGFHKESRRYYPNRELAAQLIGYVGVDNVGLAGVEASYDKVIRGRPGRLIFQHDARRRVLLSRIEQPPTAGATVELTIDAHLQHLVERELRAVVDRHAATAATAVIMDPHTGEILAMASAPTFNPNAFRDASKDGLRNRVVQNIYEPGSMFKIVTAAAALTEQVVSLDELIDCGPGYMLLGKRRISDVHRYGVMSFEDVIVKSSNVGTVKVALQLGPETLGRYARRFGFGRVTSKDFLGEEPGIVWPPAKLTDSGLASMSIGYQVSVTPLQMAAAVSSVANGGELLTPRIVRAVAANGQRRETTRQVVRRTVPPAVAAQLTATMEQVVERGTLAHFSQIDGYTIAGKTGTPRRVEGGRYAGSYNPLVVGFAPSRNPRFTIVVVVESPQKGGYYGAPIAGPVFKQIAETALRANGVPRNIDPSPRVLVARDESSSDTAAVRASMTTSDVPRIIAASARNGVMPDLSGMSAREATRVLASLGLLARLSGDGAVLRQSIAPGQRVDRGEVCTLSLGRMPLEPEREPGAVVAERKVAEASGAEASADGDDAVGRGFSRADGAPASNDGAPKGAPYGGAPYRSLGRGGGAGDAGRDPR